MVACLNRNLLALLLAALASIAFAQAPADGVTPAVDGVKATFTPRLVPLMADPTVSDLRVPPPEPFVAMQKGLREKAVTINVNYLPTGSGQYGDTCTTWPAAAQAAFNHAVGIWSSLLQSSVPITIDACWVTNMSMGVLGHSGPTTFYRDFTGAPVANTFYPVAQANSLRGQDLATSMADIYAGFSSTFSWYFGTDGATPGNQYDFVTVILHEMGHGLGFLGSMSVSAGSGSWGLGSPAYPTAYDRFTDDNAGRSLVNTAVYANPSTALGTVLTGGALYFDGANANAANGDTRVPLYAPGTWSGGSSHAHLAEIYNGTANALMTYSLGYGESIHSPGPVTLGLLRDTGWVLSSSTWTVGGTVSGLGAGKSVVLQDNGGDNLTVSANGAFTFATSVSHGGAYSVTVGTQPVGQTCTVTNGSGTATANVTNVSVSCVTNTYSIGGTLSGLGAGKSVVLQDNGGDNLTVSASGAFTFATNVAHGGAYAVTVGTQPVGQTCTVSNGSGTATANVTNVSVSCVTNTYSIGGTLSGLGAGKSVVLQNNGGNATTVSANGAFTFSTSVAYGGAYAVTVGTQPAGQTCTVTSGSGTATANVTNVSVSCATNTYSIGGTVSGLTAGKSVVLQDNGGDNLTVSASGAFTFATSVAHGGTYAVTVGTQPVGQTCSVTNGSGTATANVSNVAVSCVTNTYTIGGTVTGLGAGKSVVLRNNGGDNLTVSASGAFTFATSVAHGGAYSVIVGTQPVGQTCSVSSGSGTATADVSNVAVSCVTNTYTIGGTVTGLGAGKSVVLQDNGGDSLTVSASGAFTFATGVAHGGAYSVTVGTQPIGQTCSVSSGSGTATANVSNVAVSCVTNAYTIGGTVSGLGAGKSVVLRNNGGDNLTVSASGAFTFAASVAHGNAYSVTVGTQPVGQACSVTNGSGTATAGVSNVAVACVTNTYVVTASASPPEGGTVSCSPNPVAHGEASVCTATAVAGYAFSAFSGDCAGSTCTLANVTAPRSVTATFSLACNTGDMGDCDHDGVPNAVEVAEGLDPVAKDNDVFASARLFAMQQYRDFLGREGDPAGIAGWTGLVTAGTYARPQVIDAFVNSPEFGGTMAPVVRLYFATFLRVPDYAGLMGNAALVRAGTITTLQLAEFFAASPEFASRYGSLDNAGFVTLLYGNVLGRAPDAAGLAGWVALMDGGMTRGQVLQGFSDSPEYQAAMAHEVLVTMMYAGMLRRTPEAAGFGGWVSALDAGAWTREQVIGGFFLSAEYRGRFLP